MRRSLIASLLAVACVVPAPAGAQHAGAAAIGDHRAPFAVFSEAAAAMRDSVVALARAQLGRRYVLGGESPERGFDCSGLIRYVLGAIGVEVPRTAQQQARTGALIARDPARLRPGDLLTFGSGRSIEHVGIYVGEGRYIHASSVAGRVIESPLDRPRSPLIKPWAGARALDGMFTLAGLQARFAALERALRHGAGAGPRGEDADDAASSSADNRQLDGAASAPRSGTR